MGKSKKPSNKKSTVEAIENKELVEMVTTMMVWPASITTEAHLEKLHSKGYLTGQGLGEWRVPGEHRGPYLNPGEIVLFMPFIKRG